MWVKALCRIFFATQTDTSEIPKMKRAWMMEVIEGPSSEKSNEIATKPVPLNVLMNKAVAVTKSPTPGKKLQSSAVLPNNALMKEAAPEN